MMVGKIAYVDTVMYAVSQVVFMDVCVQGQFSLHLSY